MAASLEHRRLAIAAALRAAMAEPLPAPRELVEAPAPAEPLQHRSLREVLTAEIDWDEPEHSEAHDEISHSPDGLSSLENVDEDLVTPSVPPLEVSGSMSRVASLALFGHA